MAEDCDTKDTYVNDMYGNQIKGLTVFSIQAHRASRVMSEPMEDGCKSIDNKVVDPTQVLVEGYVPKDDEDDTMQQIYDAHANRDWKFCTVLDRGMEWKNLMLVNVKEAAESGFPDQIKVTLEFVEAMFVSSNGMSESATSDPSHSSTSAVGRVSPS